MNTSARCAFAAFAAAILIPLSADADWNPDQPAKWIQMPDETPEGMDVKLFDSGSPPPLYLADDFLCTESGPVTDVHIWASWLGDHVPDPSIVAFSVSFWTDIPTNAAGAFSRPGEDLWSTNIFFPAYTVRVWTNVIPGEGWYDPPEQVYEPIADEFIWQYNFYFDPANAFVQQGTPEQPVVYWLVIRAVVNDPDGTNRYALGWKTSIEHWNDDAVWAFDPTLWNELRYPLGHPKEGESIDLAFVITSTNVEAAAYDFGDAPTNYPVLLVNTGAHHALVPGAPWFGDPVGSGGDIDTPDSETDGQPSMNADGDDKNGASPDDEDGILFSVPIPGQAMQISMKAPVGGQIDAWIDLNADGDWTDANEQIFSGIVPPGVHAVNPVIPFGLSGPTYARFRIASTNYGPIPVDGIWPDGEVEDHLLVVPENAYDFGDAPIPGYPTTLALTGAYHVIVPGVYLGQRVDGELDGQPNGTSTGDDLAPGWLADDEDGIFLPPRLIVGAVQFYLAVASAPGELSAWVDFNADGDWADPGEALPPTPVFPGTNFLVLATPPTAVPGGVHARFRYSGTPGLPVPVEWGPWPDGEVEDYEIEIVNADFGDAPSAPYPTTLAGAGAWHVVPASPAVFLGSIVDTEPDGQPSAAADGDDLAGLADEDGVTFITPFLRGATGTVAVVASTNANLFAWIDLNGNGSWADPADKVISGLAVTAGVNFIHIPVPLPSSVGPTYARYRLSTSGSVSYGGFAPDGEVEDYRVTILQPAIASTNLVITNITVRAGATSEVYWTWQPNVTYQLQGAVNLLLPAHQGWTNIGSTVTAPAHMQSDAAAPTVRFYRVTAPWTP